MISVLLVAGLTAVGLTVFAVLTLLRPRDLASEVGNCVQVAAGGVARIVDCGARHVGQVTAVITPGGTCPTGTIGRMRVNGQSRQLCVGKG